MFKSIRLETWMESSDWSAPTGVGAHSQTSQSSPQKRILAASVACTVQAPAT